MHGLKVNFLIYLIVKNSTSGILFGFLAVIMIGSPVFAQGYSDDFRQLDEEYREKFHLLEQEYHEKFLQLEREFEEDRMYKDHQADQERIDLEHQYKIKFQELDYAQDNALRDLEHEISQSHDLTEDQTRQMFDEIFDKYEKERRALEDQIHQDMSFRDYSFDDEMYREYDNQRMVLEKEFDQKIMELEHEFDQRRMELEKDNDYTNYDDKFYDDRNYDDRNYDDRNYDDRNYDDRNYDDRNYDDRSHDYKEPHENDPEWQSIEPLANKIMDAIPMDKIERLWMAGEIDVLLDLIVSETDLTYEEAKRVLTFFEKYEGDRDDHYDGYAQTEPGYPQYDYVEQYDEPYYDDSKELLLEQRITELEDENQELRIEISEFEKQLADLNALVMEQVGFIYDWITNQ